MWINSEVELPDELVDAERDGKLVLFAGAGVSMGSPSDLPSFKQLADSIAGGTLTREDGEDYDRFLGRCELAGVQVEARARELLKRATSKPTPLHVEIVALFGKAERVHIVTTNFDEHFTTAASDLYGPGAVPSYVGPALPLGREAAGIVYLHGSLNAPRHPLVLTDAEFGRAYLSDGWATRFLLEVFTHFTVCFVGYSHEDPPMRYLARSLVPGTKRFALTIGDRDAAWAALGITPIRYPPRGLPDRHGALTDAIRAWRQQATMGSLDHADRIRDLVSKPPPLEREHVDYLRRAILDSGRLPFFVEHARGPQWLQFVVDSREVEPLFEPGGAVKETAAQLAEWLAVRFMLEHPHELMAVLQSRNMRLGNLLWDALARQLALATPRPPAELRRRWLTVLTATREPARQAHWLEHELFEHAKDDLWASLLLFGHLVESVVRFERPWSGFGEVSSAPRLRIESVTAGDPDALRKAWQDVLLPHLQECHGSLAPLLTASLTRAHLFACAAGAADTQWDPLSYSRSAIEGYESDARRQPLGVVIDAARDLLVFLLREKPATGRALRATWETSEVPILRRLAVHGHAEDPEIDPAQTLDLVLERGWLDDLTARHEVFRLVARAYGAADEPTRRVFLERALAAAAPKHPEQSDPAAMPLEAHARHNLLVWLARKAPDSRVTAERLAALQAAHPDLRPSEHPDLTHWSGEARCVVPTSPKSSSELLAHPAPDQLEELLSYESAGTDIGEPSRDGLLQAVKEAAATSFDWGLALAEALIAPGGDDRGLWTAVLSGWSEKPLPHDAWDRVLDFLWRNPFVEGAAAIWVVRLLEHAVEDESGTVDAKLRSRVVDLAERVISSGEHKEELLDADSKWLTLAINHAAGQAMLVWLRALAKDRADAGEAWRGLDGNMRSRLDAVVGRLGVSGDRARTVLASQTHFLFSLDPEWCQARVLQLFDWQRDATTAAMAWQGYLGWGHMNEALFVRMQPTIEKTFCHLGPELGGVRMTFNHLLADAAVRSTRDPWQLGSWLRRYAADAPPESRAEWAERVARDLRELSPEAAKGLWGRWLARYWEDRAGGVPRPLDPQESGAMVGWALGLAEVFPEVVAKIERTEALTLPQHGRLYRELRQSPLVQRFSTEVARLVLRLLRSSEALSWHLQDLLALVRDLIPAGADRGVLRDICQELAGRGYPAAQELGDMLNSNPPTDQEPPPAS